MDDLSFDLYQLIVWKNLGEKNRTQCGCYLDSLTHTPTHHHHTTARVEKWSTFGADGNAEYLQLFL